MNKVDLEAIQRFYNSIPSVWSDDDIWHTHSREQILTYIHQCKFLLGTDILNAGSGGSDYNLNYNRMLHVDIAEEKIKQHSDFLVSSIENIPVSSDSYDNVICVGSVLNYCDPVSSISEMDRILKQGGHLILEFESSWGFEYIGRKVYKQDAVIVNIEYLNTSHNQWLFSPQYIKGILNNYHFKIEKEFKFHIIDGIFSKLLSDRISVILSKKLDRVASKMPYTCKHANNIMYICRKLESVPSFV